MKSAAGSFIMAREDERIKKKSPAFCGGPRISFASISKGD